MILFTLYFDLSYFDCNDVDEFQTEVDGDVNRCTNECSRRKCNLKYARHRCNVINLI